MAEKLPIAVLISGTGRTLKNLIDRVEAGELDVDIRLVVSSSERALGLQYADQNNIPIAIVKSSEFKTKEEFSEAVFDACRKAKVKYVAMAGYLKLLAIPDDFANRVLNIHPSLIPSFCGENYYGRRVHDAAIRRGVKYSGATVHFVDNEYDHGPILMQEIVPVYDYDTVDTLSDRVLYDAEFVVYPKALQALAEQRVEFVEERDSFRVRVNEPTKTDGAEPDDDLE
ncbi:MAG: phosphoribosylglycinamide formyltransferase [Thermoguttaceae bacterium]|nr:phosphoribosylglycinamide formyltransferase [Thermoguttaceae bacterium]